MSNKTEYSVDRLARYNTYLSIHSLFTLILLILIFFLMAIAVDGYITFRDNNYLILMLVYVIILLAYKPILKWRFRKKLKKISTFGEVVEYIFNEKAMIVKEGEETTTITYEDIIKLKIDGDLIYLYVGIRKAFIVDSNGFVNGTKDNFFDIYRKGCF